MQFLLFKIDCVILVNIDGAFLPLVDSITQLFADAVGEKMLWSQNYFEDVSRFFQQNHSVCQVVLLSQLYAKCLINHAS